MEKKFKIRIIVCVIALLGALVVLGISTGVFTFVFKGYDSLFNLDKYAKRQMFVNEEFEISASDAELTLATVSPFDSKNTLTGKAKVSLEETADGYRITLTFKNDYGLSGGGIFSGMFPETTGKEKTAPFTDLKGCTEVTVVSGETKTEATLTSYRFKRKESYCTFSVSGVKSIDKIIIKGFVLTEFQKRA